MCQPNAAQIASRVTGCTCGCCGCGCGPGFRRFFSSQEERKRLENYRDHLKKELTGVEECIGNVDAFKTGID